MKMKNIEKFLAGKDMQIVSSAYGRVRVFRNHDGEMYDINMSGIYSALIKEAGKCKAYNSDILYDISSIHDDLCGDPGDATETKVIGFRNCGTDGMQMMDARLESPGVYGKVKEIYREIYVVKMKFTADSVRVNLYKVM